MRVETVRATVGSWGRQRLRCADDPQGAVISLDFANGGGEQSELQRGPPSTSATRTSVP